MTIAPDLKERAEDERALTMLSLWDHHGMSAGDIGRQLGVSRNVPLAKIWRVHKADPDALDRKPASCVKGY